MMIINSTHDSADIASKLLLLPGRYFKENYTRMMNSVKFWVGFKNSLIISISSTVLSAYFGALTAYGFSKYRFRYKNVFFWILLGSMMVPSQLGLIGFFKVCSAFKLIDKHIALIIPAIANANLVFFVKLYIDSTVPDSLIECARIDGCGEFAIFNRIALPIASPAIATMSIFTFITSWNSYLTPLVVLYNENNYTVPLMTAIAKGVYRTDFGAVYICIAMSMIPIMIMFAFCSKYIISGVTAGAIKE
jgi:multiple sugar transport system permease protein